VQTFGLILVVLVALGFAYTNGFHDSANAIATSVSTRALTRQRRTAAWKRGWGQFRARRSGMIGLGILTVFIVVALAALYGTPDTVANVALTGLLSMNAVGVLFGGLLASRTTRHVTVAALSLALAGAATFLMGVVGHSTAALIAMSSLAGLFAGIVSPSRDMLVRSVTPPGAFGRVFGFVSSGFNIGSMFAPMIYAMMMDRGEPRAVFMISAACSLLCIGTVVFGISGRKQR